MIWSATLPKMLIESFLLWPLAVHGKSASRMMIIDLFVMLVLFLFFFCFQFPYLYRPDFYLRY